MKHEESLPEFPIQLVQWVLSRPQEVGAIISTCFVGKETEDQGGDGHA